MEAALTTAEDERATWGRWLASTTRAIPAAEWRSYQKDTFEVTLRYMPLGPVGEPAAASGSQPPPGRPLPNLPPSTSRPVPTKQQSLSRQSPSLSQQSPSLSRQSPAFSRQSPASQQQSQQQQSQQTFSQQQSMQPSSMLELMQQPQLPGGFIIPGSQPTAGQPVVRLSLIS